MTLAYWGKLRSFHRDIWLALSVWLLMGLCFDGIFTVLFNLYLLRLGYGPEFVGTANAVSLVVQALFSPLAGLWGTRRGSRAALATGVVGFVSFLALVLLAEFIAPAWRAGWILVMLSLASLGLALIFVNMAPLLMAITDDQERTHAFSISQAMRQLAAFVGGLVGGGLPPLLAGLLRSGPQEAAPYRWALLCAALLFIPAAIALLAIHPSSTRGAQGKQDVAGNMPWRLIALMTVVLFLLFAGGGPILIFLNVYLDARLQVATSLIGALTALSKLASIPMALTFPFWVRRFGLFRSLLWGLVGMALALLPLALIPQWDVAGASYTVWAIFNALAMPAITIYSMELVAPRWHAAMSSITGMFVCLAMAGISFAGGYVIEALGYRTLFLIGLLLSLLSPLVLWLCFRHPRGELARTKLGGFVQDTVRE